MKVYPDCKELKSYADFGRNAGLPDGLAFYCRTCFSRRSAIAYRKKRAAAGAEVREPRVVPAGHKYCPDCREVQPETQFHKASRQAGGRASYCASCKYRRDSVARHMKLYGITLQERDDLVSRQDGLCAICRTGPAEHVDHDHATGRVRGVLCFSCNVAIGHLRDSADLLRAAINYLETSACTTQDRTAGSQPRTPRPAAPPSRTS